MTIFLTIIATAIVDWLLGTVVSIIKNKKIKREENLFRFKLEQILSNKNQSININIEKAKNLCLQTEGKLSAGTYFALDALK